MIVLKNALEDKEDVVYVYMEYYSAIRNDKYPPFASMWMELEGIMLSEISHSENPHPFGEYK